jgi:hypothetical protein
MNKESITDMGRESRQARRARERRQQQKAKAAPASNRNFMYAGIAAVIALLVIGGIALSRSSTPSSSNATPTLPPVTPAPAIAGMHCGTSGEVTTFHQHAHLMFVVNGQETYAPALIGQSLQDCLYWLHTHQTDGVIHMEAPSQIAPPLSTFFKIWGQPISRTRVWKYAVKPGEQMRVIVNGKVFSGNPANIILKRHELITIEIGPPFEPQKPFTWGAL